MRMSCGPDVVHNFWDYYFLRGGFKRKARLILRTKGDAAPFQADPSLDQGRWKALAGLLRAGRIEYSLARDEMTVSSANGAAKERLSPADFLVAEVLAFGLDHGIKLASVGHDHLKASCPGDLDFWVRRSVRSDTQVLWEDTVEEQYAFLYPYLPGSVVLDIGAYIGDSAVFFISRGARRVLAYEPHPELYSLAVKNVELNKMLDRVSIYNLGVGPVEGTVSVREDTQGFATSGFGLSGINKGREISFQVAGLARILDQCGQVDVVKMDCEGAEFDTLLSMPAEQLRRVKVWGVEFHRDPQPLVAHLRQAGFVTEVIKEENRPGYRVGLLLATLSGMEAE